jgi:predicted MPP superfamily phosphohydrolase
MIGICRRSILFGITVSLAAALSAANTAFSEEIQLKFDRDGRFKIVQFTDLHLHEGGDKDHQTLTLIGEILDIEKPQLVVLTGDTLSGAAKRQETVALVAGPMAERKIPWAVVLGNHDDEWPKDVEKPKDRRGLMEMFVRQPCSVSKVGPEGIFGASNYCLPVYDADGTRKKWALYMLDSNAYPPKKELGSYDWIHSDQIAWYSQTSKALAEERDGKPCPALAFFHIPLPEYEYALTDAQTDVVGHRHEGVACSRINSGLFAAMLERGDMKGVFVGHDHVSDFEARYRGVRLIYGRATGTDTYGRDGFPRGGRVILLEESGDAFTTWIRLQGGDKVQY